MQADKGIYAKAFHSADLSGKAFLVTGGAGFIGSNIAEYLLLHGAGRVVVLDNLVTGHRRNIEPFLSNPAFTFIEGDITNPQDCARACAGIDYVSHQAALGSVPRSIKDPAKTNDTNITGFLNMLIAAKDAGVKKFVYASSSSVYGDEPTLPKVEHRIGKPLSPYAVTKYTNELYAMVFYRNYQFPVTGLRYFNIFGPRQDPEGQYAAVIPLFVSKILSQSEVFIDGSGEQTRDFTFVANAVKANLLAMLSEESKTFGEVYNIACGENFSVNFMYEKIRDILNIPHQPKYREERLGDIKNSLADISKAQTHFGYAPEVNFMEGLQTTVHYFKDWYAKKP